MSALSCTLHHAADQAQHQRENPPTVLICDVAQVIRSALQAGQVDPSTVGALEMHGTGTSLGDPIEVGAAFAVLQPPSEPAFAAGAPECCCMQTVCPQQTCAGVCEWPVSTCQQATLQILAHACRGWRA